MPATAPLRHLKECRQRKCNTGEIPHATLRKSICIFKEKVLAKNTLKQRFSELKSLSDALRMTPNLIFLFDEVDAGSKKSCLQKLELVRKLYSQTGIPTVLCGTQKLYRELHDERRFDDYCSILSRLDEHEMRGMRRQDAADYLAMVAREERVRFTWQAQQALIPVALNKRLGGLSSFVKIIGRAITHARAHYYTTDGRTIPENAKCIRPEIKEGIPYPGTKVSFTLPVTPELLVVDEYLVSSLLADFKSQCRKIQKKKSSKP